MGGAVQGRVMDEATSVEESMCGVGEGGDDWRWG